MSVETKALFVVSSGRSGTAMLHKALSATGSVEMHHEYMVHIVQPLAVRRYMGWASFDDAMRVLHGTHAAAIHFSRSAYWGDSSNKLSWLIPELAELAPRAKFIHLVRDGRKVASSYFHKLGDECYDDGSTAVLASHADNVRKCPAPPPEKKYWWPLPRPDNPIERDFRRFDRFERICWHWAEINRVILDSLAALPTERKHVARLEVLQETPSAVRSLFDFVGIPFDASYSKLFARPHNVGRPQDCPLDGQQTRSFDRIAGPMMQNLGYAGTPEYVVKY